MNPYHDMQWSEGFSYVPPPSDPFLPHSGAQMGMFIVDGDKNVHSQNWTGPIPSTDDVNGMFGAGPLYTESAFWFDASAAWVGCTNDTYSLCLFTVNGWRLDAGTGQSQMEVSQLWEVPTCNQTGGCELLELPLSSDFANLTALEFVVTVGPSQTPHDWYVDDIELAWTNNTCAAIQQRDNLFSVSQPPRHK
jgi:hypothetical protein